MKNKFLDQVLLAREGGESGHRGALASEMFSSRARWCAYGCLVIKLCFIHSHAYLIKN